MSLPRLLRVIVAAACLSTSGVHAQDTFQDALVQPPGLKPPQRGSVAGSLARFSASAGQLSRGTLSLPLPIELPSTRSQPLADFIPSYSTEGGASEWGTGWAMDLEIRRHRVLGDVEYDETDEFTSPWGRLVRGDDGFYYPAGLRSVVRAEARSDGSWIATTGDGTRYTFLRSDSVATSHGVYAWKLSRVESVLGDVTALSWTVNATGRRFLERVTWGNRQQAAQFELRIAYEALSRPLVSYASRARQELDRRVVSVGVFARDQASQMRERWTYRLTYESSALSPTFYLATLQRQFAAGDFEPAVRYQYDIGLERLQNAQLRPEPSLDNYLSITWGAGLAPDHASMLDVDDDGVPELEHHYANALVRRKASRYEFEALPPAPGQVNQNCRPSPSADNQPRVLAKMRPSAAEPNVVVAYRDGLSSNSIIEICDRVGTTLTSLRTAGAWDLGANTRLVDLDSDRKPDFISVFPGGVEVLANTSTSSAWSFAARPAQALSPALSATASWVVDLNGDTQADVVSRTSAGLTVWYGKGHLQFETEGEFLTFDGEGGGSASDINQYDVTFGDLNGDGLSDALLTRTDEVLVYFNQLDHFYEVEVPGLVGQSFTFSLPRIADVAASGDAEVVFVRDNKAFTIALNGPSTGLLRSVDDGKGTKIELSYSRASAATGLEQRATVLSALSVTSAGKGSVIHGYEYAEPVAHSQGGFLLGFSRVTSNQRITGATPAVLSTRATFRHDDDAANIALGTTSSDSRVSGVEQFVEREFESVRFHGVPWRRLLSSDEGQRSTAANGTVVATNITYEAYEREHCPVRTVTSTSTGVLVRDVELAAVAGLPSDLQCMESARVISGVHSDRTLDFEHTLLLERNDIGQILKASQDGPSGPVVLQQNVYNAAHLLESSSSPASGTTRFEHDGVGRLFRITAPDGRVTRIGAFDDATDAIKEFREERGNGVVAQYSYLYDGMERLKKSWDNFSGSSATSPSETVSYNFATASQPGRIDFEELVDADAQVRRRGAELVSADGEKIADAHWAGKWLLSRVARADSAQGANVLYERAPIGGASALASLDFNTLFNVGTEQVLRSVSSPFGFATETQRLVQSNVRGGTTTTWTIVAGELIERRSETGGGTSQLVYDGEGRVVRAQDPQGAQWHYLHDALGRLVEVKTPDGVQRLTYDGYGRPAKVDRAGLVSITYGYEPSTGRRSEKKIYSAAGALQRTERMSYDAFGRRSVTTLQSGSSTSQLRYDYDGVGAQGDGSTAPGQLGHLSRMRAEQYERRQRIDAAGRVVSSVEKLGNGWREVTRDVTYRSSGDTKGVSVSVRDSAGALKQSTRLRTEVDAFGRIERGYVNDALLYTLSYGTRGKLDRAVFADGHVLAVQYDARTNQRSGYTLRGPVQDGGVAWTYDVRGLVASERYTRGATTVERRFQYDTRGYLQKSTEGGVESTFSYSLAGLPLRVKDVLGERQVERGTARVGTSTYRWDNFGRVTNRDDLTVTYGANGEIASATRGNRKLRYFYDEKNQRVLKTTNGTPERAWVAGGVLTASALYLPVEIEGILVGVLENGTFKPVITDERGTPTTSLAGAASLATVYGVRSSRDSFAEVVDFTRLGYDADLGTVRMGLRDYDAKLSQFWTPDPLFLESLGACQESPVECGLYGYAANNPLSFTDPSGTSAKQNQEGSGAAMTVLKEAGNFLDGVVSGISPFDDQREDPLFQASENSELIWNAGRLAGSVVGLVGDAWSAATGVTLVGAGAPLLVAGGAGAVPMAAGAGLVAVAVVGAKSHTLTFSKAAKGIINKVAGAGGGGEPPMLGARGTKFASKTAWSGEKGMRIDVENPNPGQRAGQIHFQQQGQDFKYYYDPATKTFGGAPNWVNKLLSRPDVQKGIEKAMKFLGET